MSEMCGGEGMSKRTEKQERLERIRWMRRIFDRLERNKFAAYSAKDAINFDWYGNGQEVYFQILMDWPFKVTPRVKAI